MRGLICGPKLAACGVVLSAWGVIMLAILGAVFTTHSAMLIHDVPLTGEDVFKDPNSPQRIYDLYEKIGYNCLIAAAVYAVLGVVSCCQMRLNRKKAFLVQ